MRSFSWWISIFFGGMGTALSVISLGCKSAKVMACVNGEVVLFGNMAWCEASKRTGWWILDNLDRFQRSKFGFWRISSNKNGIWAGLRLSGTTALCTFDPIVRYLEAHAINLGIQFSRRMITIDIQFDRVPPATSMKNHRLGSGMVAEGSQCTRYKQD